MDILNMANVKTTNTQQLAVIRRRLGTARQGLAGRGTAWLGGASANTLHLGRSGCRSLAWQGKAGRGRANNTGGAIPRKLSVNSVNKNTK